MNWMGYHAEATAQRHRGGGGIIWANAWITLAQKTVTPLWKGKGDELNRHSFLDSTKDLQTKKGLVCFPLIDMGLGILQYFARTMSATIAE
jgi:hypothetical protein